MAKTDRRVQRTKQKLNDALMTLIREKRYEQVTVQDITERANLSRATFYLHYKDKDDLFNESLARLMEEVVGQFQRWTNPMLALSDEPAQHIFQLVADNHDLYRVLLSEQGNSMIGPQLRIMLAKGLEDWLRMLGTPAFEQSLDVPLDLLCGYTANALFGLIAWWLDNDMPYSVAYMAQMSRQLNLFGIMPFMMGATIRPIDSQSATQDQS